MIIIAIMIRLLSVTIAIKNARLKKQNKRRVNAHCLAPIKMVGLVHVRKRKKKTEKLLG